MRRMPIPYRRSFPLHAMRRGGLRGIRPNFSGLFPCRGQVAYVLLTSAPVAIRSVATPMLPLDLHVLSLSLAFILSQDQTLRCVLSSLLFLLQKMTPSTSTAVPLLSATPHWPRLTRRPSPAGAALAGRDVYLHLSLGILTAGAPRNPRFLVSHLLVRFPHRKHVNDLSKAPRPLQRPFDKASKKPLNSDRVLVSRKAMQNYSLFPTWQNIFTEKCRKIKFLTSFH